MRRRMRKDKRPIRKLAINTIKINRARDKRAEIPAFTIEENLNAFKSIVYTVSEEKLSIAERKHKDYFDGNSMELENLINNSKLARNNMVTKSGKSTEARNRICCELLKQWCREYKNKWWSTKQVNSKHL